MFVERRTRRTVSTPRPSEAVPLVDGPGRSRRSASAVDLAPLRSTNQEVSTATPGQTYSVRPPDQTSVVFNLLRFLGPMRKHML